MNLKKIPAGAAMAGALDSVLWGSVVLRKPNLMTPVRAYRELTVGFRELIRPDIIRSARPDKS